MHITNIKTAKINCKVVWLIIKAIQMLPMERNHQNVWMMNMKMMI